MSSFSSAEVLVASHRVSNLKCSATYIDFQPFSKSAQVSGASRQALELAGLSFQSQFSFAFLVRVGVLELLIWTLV